MTVQNIIWNPRNNEEILQDYKQKYQQIKDKNDDLLKKHLKYKEKTYLLLIIFVGICIWLLLDSTTMMKQYIIIGGSIGVGIWYIKYLSLKPKLRKEKKILAELQKINHDFLQPEIKETIISMMYDVSDHISSIEERLK